LIPGVVYEGIAIPLFWKLPNKAGNARTKEHIAMTECFMELFGQARIAGI
jgi:hypothetical protein